MEDADARRTRTRVWSYVRYDDGEADGSWERAEVRVLDLLQVNELGDEVRHSHVSVEVRAGGGICARDRDHHGPELGQIQLRAVPDFGNVEIPVAEKILGRGSRIGQVQQLGHNRVIVNGRAKREEESSRDDASMAQIKSSNADLLIYWIVDCVVRVH